ncbi:c-type cytochrome [Candidatus Caldipriscus sp.]|nr:c-type cytochrome [Candidatus Caldipriscus sp.]
MVRALLIFGILLISCRKETTPTGPDTGESINYDRDIQPIWNRNCTSCHSGSSPSGGLDLSAGVSYSNLVNVISPTYNVWRVRSGKIYGGKMPPGGSLSSDEINLIRKWIEELKDTIIRPSLSTSGNDLSLKIDYQRQIQPIWNSRCVSYHSGSFPAGGLNLSSGFSYSQLVDVISPNYGVWRVWRGRPDSSVLFHKIINTRIYGGRMPPSGKLSESEIMLIEKWIREL